MANELLNFTNSFLGSLNAVNSAYGDSLRTEADLVTKQKRSKLQQDINNKIMEISSNGKWDTWNDEINNFFEQKKNEMSDENSPYYCRNNLQAEMFDEALNDSLVSVSYRVAQMAQERQGQQLLVDNQKAKDRALQLGMVGTEYYNYSNNLDDAAETLNLLDPNTKLLNKRENFYKGYSKEIDTMYNLNADKLLQNGNTFNDLWTFVENNKSEMDSIGLSEGFDTNAIKAQLKSKYESDWKARQRDMWNETEKTFSNMYDNMLDQRTAEGYNNVALQARGFIDSIKNTGKASPEQISKWTKVFQLIDDATLDKKFGGGSGSVKKDDLDKYEDLFKNNGDTAVKLWEDGLRGNMYDITGMMGAAFTREWWNPIYKENYNKTPEELENIYKMKYEGKTSQNNIVDAVFNEFIDKFPEIKDLVKKDFENLRNDMQKHPDQYGTQDVEKMGYFLLNEIYSADPNTKSEDILKRFEQYKNDCYLSRIKFVELNGKGNLTKTFDATKPQDIASAAKLAMDNDFVYTWKGKEYWADGKQEALEAPGGIVNVLQTAVIGTLDIPQSDVEAGKVRFKYKQTKDDMTSQPIITYDGHEYEVIPDENGKGFSVRDINTDERFTGKIGNNKAVREEAKQQAKQTIKDTHGNTTEIEGGRADELNNKINDVVEMPKAMKAAGKTKDTAWNDSKGKLSDRQIYLQDTVSAINDDANKVKNTLDNPNTKKKKQMQPSEFEAKYGIDYYDWMRSSETTYRFNLILDSK